MTTSSSDDQSDHVNEKFRHVLQFSDAERISFLQEDRWIGYERARVVLELLTSLLNAPTRIRPRNYLIVGEPNNGKTTLVRRFVEQCGQPYADENVDPVKPIILTDAPPTPDEKGLYACILDQFWSPYRASSTALALRNQAVLELRRCKTRLIIIDEFHSVLAGTKRKQGEVMNAIKYLSNVCAVPIIGAGTSNAVQVLHTDPQHSSRFQVLPLPLWEPDPEFQTLLAGFESVLPLRKRSDLRQPTKAGLLHMYSAGVLGDLQSLLQELAEEAIRKGTEEITEAAIRRRGAYRSSKLRGKAA